MPRPTRIAPPAGRVFSLEPLRRGPASLAVEPSAVIVWKDVARQLPDAEVEVLVAHRDSADTHQAYLCDILEDGSAVFAYVNSGMPIRPTVYAWADMPAAPSRDQFAKGGA